MSNAVECARCHIPMEPGFMIDGRHEGFAQQQWSSGDPKPSFWMGLKLKRENLIPVRTWRCPNCGYLQSHAVREKETE